MRPKARSLQASRAPILAHATGPVRRDVVEELQLYLHGLAFSDSTIQVSALSPDGRALVVYEDARKTAEGLRSWSAKDAARWQAFQVTLQRLGALIGSLFINTPPSVDAPTARDVFALMHTLGDFRSLPKDDQWRLLRWGPMAVADLVSESIDTELLRATVAADGIFGAMLGPWSAGSGLQLLLSSANRALAWPGGHLIAGGPIALARSLESRGDTIRRRDPDGLPGCPHRREGRSRRRRDARWRRAHRGARGGLGRRSEAHVPHAL